MKRFTQVAFIVGVICLISYSHLFATDLDPDRLIPTKDLFSEQEIRNFFYNMSFKPLGREDLAFSLLVPKTWKSVPIKPSKDQVVSGLLQGSSAKDAYKKKVKQGTLAVANVLLARIVAPRKEEKRASIQVTCFRTPFEEDTRDLMALIAQSQGWEKLFERRDTFNGRKVYDALFRAKQKKVTWLTRVTVSKHGERVFTIYCAAPEPQFEKYAKIFGAAAISFTVKKKSPTPFAEPMRIYLGKRVPILKFRYPSSWVVKEPIEIPEGISGVDLVLPTIAGGGLEEAGAYLRVVAVPLSYEKNPDIVFEIMKEDYTAAGIKLVKPGDPERLKGRFIHPPVKAQIWNVNTGEDKGELALVLFARADCYIGLGLLTTIFGTDESLAGYREMEIAAEDLLSTGKKPAGLENIDLKKLVNTTMYLFADAVSSGDFSKLYETCASSVKEEMTAEEFADAFSSFVEGKVDVSIIKGTDPIFDNKPSIDPSRPLVLKGKYYTKLMTVKFRLTCLYEDNKWKLMGINVAAGAPEPPLGKALQVPPRSDLVKLVNRTMILLARSIKNEDFTQMYRSIASMWQKQTSEEELAGGFSAFVEKKIDLTEIQGKVPVFEDAPVIEQGTLHVRGHYDLSKMKLTFDLKYWMEGSQWRLIGINVSTKSK